MAVSELITSFGSRFDLSTNLALSTSGEPIPEDEEQTKILAHSISVHLGGEDAGSGTLHITTRRVIWVSSSGAAISLRYQQMVMHAISRDASATPQKPCIYLQLDDGSEDMQEGSDDEAEVGLEPEIRLIPEDPAKVEEIFAALCECAALNPDPQEDGEGDFFFDEDEVLAGMDEEARTALVARQVAEMELEEGAEELGELVGGDPSRFDDDDEDEEEEKSANGHA